MTSFILLMMSSVMLLTLYSYIHRNDCQFQQDEEFDLRPLLDCASNEKTGSVGGTHICVHVCLHVVNLFVYMLLTCLFTCC